MADPGRGNEVEHAFQQSVARPQHRDEDQLLAREDRRLHLHDGGLYAFRPHGEIPGDLVAQQHADLADELAEHRRRRLLAAHQGELVLDQRVVDDDDIFHMGSRWFSAAPAARGA